MENDDLIGDMLIAIEVGKIDIPDFPIPMPIFYIDLGEDQPSLVEQFEQYNKITLTITPINAFAFNYEVHGDIMHYTITKEISDRVARGEKLEAVLCDYEGKYTFLASRMIKLHWHSVFGNARKRSLGSWILLLHGATSNIILIDRDGNIVGRGEKPRQYFAHMYDQKTP
jgi:hypothetical protein